MYEAFEQTVTSLPMPRMSSSDSDSDDSDDVDSALGLVLDRSATSSTASMEPMERLEALQRVNADLGKKLVEAERTLQRKLSDHESELEEMEARLEEAKTELSAAKREEKELRNKERSNQTQIAALESEIAKVQKTLDNSRTMYNSLQKQYQEQLRACFPFISQSDVLILLVIADESEDLRNTLRRKDEEIRSCRESLSLQQMETSKFLKENEAYEERIVLLEQDLALAQQAQTSLDEQKQENLMLKETIDRMRFDMDELRSTLTSNAAGSSGTGSAPGSVSRSLGAELLSKMKDDNGWIDDEDEADAAATLKELGIENPDENTDDEDIVQTIITRKKKVCFTRPRAFPLC
jgi:DNA repair exonuclease SbcCD ATPase subunit